MPFVGRAGKLLETLLGEIGLARGDVFIANVLKCLRYNAPVQLGDGSWERIGRLVRSRYDGDVMYDGFERGVLAASSCRSDGMRRRSPGVRVYRLSVRIGQEGAARVRGRASS